MIRRPLSATIESTAKLFDHINKPHLMDGDAHCAYTPDALEPSRRVVHTGTPRLRKAADLSPSQVTELKDNAEKLHRAGLEIDRKIAHRQSLPDGPGKAAELTQLQSMKAAIEAHPLHDRAAVSNLAKEVNGYNGWRRTKDGMWQAKSRLGGFMQENRWAAVPMAGGALALKLTVGLWMLHEFDRLFGTKSAQGKPFSQAQGGLLNPQSGPPQASSQPAQPPRVAAPRMSPQAPTAPQAPGAPPVGYAPPQSPSAQPSVQQMNQAFAAPLYVPGQAWAPVPQAANAAY